MKIEYVTWLDSYGCSASWQEIEGMKVGHAICYSTGFIIGETEEYLVIAAHYSPQNDQIGSLKSAYGEMAIPKCSIIDRKVLWEVSI